MVLQQGSFTAAFAIIFIACIAFTLGAPSVKDEFAKGSDALKYTPLIDGHNDLPFTLYQNGNNDLNKYPFEKNLTDDQVWGKKNCKTCHTDLPSLIAGKVGGQLWSAYVSCESQYKDAVELTLSQIDVIKRFVKKYPKHLEFATESDEIERTWRRGKIVSMIGVEGGHSIDSSLAVLRLYYELGVRYLTLTHKCNTPWADASPTLGNPVYNLTEFGETIIAEMNRLGMMVDLSHVSHNVMRSVLAISTAPVIFSHSSAYTVCNHDRNVPDDVLHQVKANGGIVMVNFYDGFVNCDKSRNASIEDVVAHINYIRKFIGVDHVGIGGDYNGVSQMPIGLEDVSKYPALFDRLYANKEDEPKWSKEDLEKLAGKNFIRVLKAVEMVRDSTAASESPYENVISAKELKIAQEKEGLNPPGSCQTAKIWRDMLKG